MAKLNLYTQYYYAEDYNDVGCGLEEESYGDSDYDLLKQAFEKLCEQDIRPGKINYNHYMSIKAEKNMFTNRVINGTGFGEGKGRFCRVG